MYTFVIIMFGLCLFATLICVTAVIAAGRPISIRICKKKGGEHMLDISTTEPYTLEQFQKALAELA